MTTNSGFAAVVIRCLLLNGAHSLATPTATVDDTLLTCDERVASLMSRETAHDALLVESRVVGQRLNNKLPYCHYLVLSEL